MVWRAFSRDRGLSVDRTATVDAIAVMSGVVRSCDSQDFRGGELTAIMGGCEIDLRGAAIQEDEAVLQVFAFWGGIEIKVPEDWSVVSKVLPLMGGFEDKTNPSPGEPRKKLSVHGLVVMGGVEIKN